MEYISTPIMLESLGDRGTEVLDLLNDETSDFTKEAWLFTWLL